MIKVKELPISASIADHTMWPLMFVLGGWRRDSVHETHCWHNQVIDKSEINSSLSVVVTGDDDRTGVKTNHVLPLPLFHIPILGGWRNYVVLQVQSDARYWHVGWIHRACTPGSRLLATVQRLRIVDRKVKVLTQAVGFVTEFFALDPVGGQLPLSVVDNGILGDMKYPSIKLL
jgi:hypothetical protein